MFYYFFSDHLIQFSKESQSHVSQKFCEISQVLAKNCDYELAKQQGWLYRLRQNNVRVYDTVKKIKKHYLYLIDEEMNPGTVRKYKRVVEVASE